MTPRPHRNPTRRILVVLAIVLSLLAAACGDDGGAASPAPDDTTTTTAPTGDTDGTDSGAEPDDPAEGGTVDEDPVDEADGGEADVTDDGVVPAVYPRTIEHALGSTEIPEEPQVIVALDMSVVDPVLRLGLDLAGYTTFADPDGPLPDYFGDVLAAQAADAVWVGDLMEPNLEVIAELRPDVIISSAVRHESIYDQLSQIAPTVMAESGGGGWKDNLSLVAETTGREELAVTELEAYEERAASVGTAVNAAAGDPTISVVRFTADALRLYQPVSFSGTVLADAGLGRPDSQQDQEDFILVISEEELPLADADVLIYTAREDSPADDFAAGITSRGLWGSLSAVQAGQVHRVADETWMSGVGLFGAHIILDDLETIFAVG